MHEKRGLSPVIGYVLLISFVIILSAGVFQWVETYIPKDNFRCQEGISVFVKESEYGCTDNENLSITLKNNGRFGIAGFFIRASNDQALDLATLDLSYSILSGGEEGEGNILYNLTNKTNVFKPGEEVETIFNLSKNLLTFSLPIYFVEIIPIRYEEADNRLRLASCGEAKIKHVLCGQQPTCNPPCGLGQHCEVDICVNDQGCGNGIPEAGEQCDDGNTNSGDGCSNICSIEIYVLGYHGFESNKEGWFTTDSPSSNPDSERVTSNSKLDNNGNNGGTASLHIQDDSSNSYISKSNFNLSAYKNLTITWWGRYLNFDNNECIQLRIAGVNIRRWGNDADISTCHNHVTNSNSDSGWVYQSVSILDDEYFNFTNTFNAEIRFVGATSADDDDFYIDGINITARKI